MSPLPAESTSLGCVRRRAARWSPTLLALAVCALAVACASPGADGPSARAELAPTAGQRAQGWVEFAQIGRRVRVTAEVQGLAPNVEHGFHVHEKGDCSAPDAMSAGGHFNPGGQPHGHPGQGVRHAGDMPNLAADAQGRARLTWTTDALSVAAGPASVIGRGVVIHRDPDDYRSQPAGNSGPRLACGVVAAR